MNNNPKDPLLKAGPTSEKELFYAISKVCSGFPSDCVTNVAANLLINVVRQTQPTRVRAEIYIDELIGRVKSILLDQHYDSTGRKKGIFPYTQNIFVDHFDARRER